MEKKSSSFPFNTNPNPCNNVCSSAYYSDGCKCFYLILIIISVLTAIITLIDLQQIVKHSALSVFETILNSITIIDIIWRFYMIGCSNYWRQWGNYFEMLSLIFCSVSIYLSFSIHVLGKLEVEALSDNAVISIRSLAQYMRVGVLFKNSNEIGRNNHIILVEEESRASSMNIDAATLDMRTNT